MMTVAVVVAAMPREQPRPLARSVMTMIVVMVVRMSVARVGRRCMRVAMIHGLDSGPANPIKASDGVTGGPAAVYVAALAPRA